MKEFRRPNFLSIHCRSHPHPYQALDPDCHLEDLDHRHARKATSGNTIVGPFYLPAIKAPIPKEYGDRSNKQ